MTKHNPPPLQQKKRQAAQEALEDVLWLVRGGSEVSPVDSAGCELDGEKFAELLKRNFKRLDPTGTAITKEHLAKALMKPDQLNEDEWVMLQLLAKYFDTIANMCEDEPGPQTVITSLDSDVLCQFLVHSKLSLSELHQWRKNAEREKLDAADFPPPPPLSY